MNRKLNWLRLGALALPFASILTVDSIAYGSETKLGPSLNMDEVEIAKKRAKFVRSPPSGMCTRAVERDGLARGPHKAALLQHAKDHLLSQAYGGMSTHIMLSRQPEYRGSDKEGWGLRVPAKIYACGTMAQRRKLYQEGTCKSSLTAMASDRCAPRKPPPSKPVADVQRADEAPDAPSRMLALGRKSLAAGNAFDAGDHFRRAHEILLLAFGKEDPETMVAEQLLKQALARR